MENRRQLGLLLAGFGLALGSTSCGNASSSEDRGARWYHAYIVSANETKTPFFLQLPADCGTAEAVIINGEERIRAACYESEKRVRVNFPVYGTRIDAGFDVAGRLSGTWYRDEPSGAPVYAFEARPIFGPAPEARSQVDPGGAKWELAAADFTGTWRLELDRSGMARGIFVQNQSGVVTGTIEIPSSYGDLRLLAGNASGAVLEASRFDGQVAILLRAEMQADGTIHGRLRGHRVFDHSWDSFVGKRTAGFATPDPLKRVSLMPGNERLARNQRLARYAGKPLIVDIFGTWCPNCGDHARLLAELYRKHHAQGLEILGFAFEYAATRESRQERLRAFEIAHDVQWEVVIPETPLQDTFAELSTIEGVPVTIFMTRGGAVHAIYAGFPSPATGEAYRDAKTLFEHLTAEILNSADKGAPSDGVL